MKRDEWQKHYQLTDEEMEILCKWLWGTKGEIVAVVDNPERKIL